MSNKEGWAKLGRRESYHYIRNGRSLCGKHVDVADDHIHSYTMSMIFFPCRSCMKKLSKEARRHE